MKMPVLYTVFQVESNTGYHASKQQFKSTLNAKGFFQKYMSCLSLAGTKTFPMVLLHKFQHGVIDVVTDVIQMLHINATTSILLFLAALIKVSKHRPCKAKHLHKYR